MEGAQQNGTEWVKYSKEDSGVLVGHCQEKVVELLVFLGQDDHEVDFCHDGV